MLEFTSESHEILIVGGRGTIVVMDSMTEEIPKLADEVTLNGELYSVVGLEYSRGMNALTHNHTVGVVLKKQPMPEEPWYASTWET